MSAAEPTGFLAIPAAGDRSVARLRRKLGLLLLQRLLEHSGEGLPPAFGSLQAALPAIARAHPAPVHAACANLDFRANALAGEWGEAMPAFLLALARRLPRGVFEETLLWDRPLARLPDREGGCMHELDPPARGMVVSGSGAELRDAQGRFHDLLAPRAGDAGPFYSIRGEAAGPCLATVDTNPLAMLEEHPGKSGNAVDLAGRSPRQWCDGLAAALDVIEVALPSLHGELIDSLERVVPVGYEPEIHLSASYLEAPGLVYLTLHPNPLTLAEALIHETQHGKLNLLSWFDPVLHNGHTEWAPSSVRPDLRPLRGVLLAVHAFAPVAAMHKRLAELDHPLSRTDTFERRRAQVIGANAAGLATLLNRGDPSPPGRRVLDALSELHTFVAEAAPKVDTQLGTDALG